MQIKEFDCTQSADYANDQATFCKSSLRDAFIDFGNHFCHSVTILYIVLARFNLVGLVSLQTAMISLTIFLKTVLIRSVNQVSWVHDRLRPVFSSLSGSYNIGSAGPPGLENLQIVRLLGFQLFSGLYCCY